MINNINRNWRDICSPNVALDLPQRKWEYDWGSHSINLVMLYNAIRIFKPKILVETGTFEGQGTYVMARAAHENNNDAHIITIDYGGDPDPTFKLPKEKWTELERIRQQNLSLISDRFPKVEVSFWKGDTRDILPAIFPEKYNSWDFFYQDSMHFFEGIMAEWTVMEKYSSKGAIVVFDDIQFIIGFKKVLHLRKLLSQREFCSWFVWHEVINGGWIYKSINKGHGQFWAQKVKNGGYY